MSWQYDIQVALDIVQLLFQTIMWCKVNFQSYQKSTSGIFMSAWGFNAGVIFLCALIFRRTAPIVLILIPFFVLDRRFGLIKYAGACTCW